MLAALFLAMTLAQAGAQPRGSDGASSPALAAVSQAVIATEAGTAGGLRVHLGGEPAAAYLLLVARQVQEGRLSRDRRLLAAGTLDAEGHASVDLRRLPLGLRTASLQLVWTRSGGRPAWSAVSAPLAVAIATAVPAPPPPAAGGHVPIPLRIVSCSLGCSGLAGQVHTCAVTSAAVNAPLRVDFTLELELSSLSMLTFQLVSVQTGLTPSGLLGLDPGEAAALVFQPTVAFDALGNPVFGLKQGETYLLRIPGANHDAPPFLRSVTGADNLDRLQCSFTAQGLIDLVPGPPSALVTVDVVTGYDPVTGLPSSFAYAVPAAGATNVWVDSDITLAFDDVMIAGTLFDFGTGQPTNVRVWIDNDGDLATTADRSAQPGSFSFQVDLATPSTQLVFDPLPALPHSGGGPSPKLVVVETFPGATDLVGNPLANAGTIAFQTEP